MRSGEKDEIYEKTKKIIKEYCADNILDTSDIEEPVEEIVRILNRNLDEYVRFFCGTILPECF